MTVTGALSDGVASISGGVLSGISQATIESSEPIFTVKSNDASDGVAKLRLVSDNSGEKGDGIEIKTINGTTTFSSDHNSIGQFNEPILSLIGHDDDASKQVIVTGDLSATSMSLADNN